MSQAHMSELIERLSAYIEAIEAQTRTGPDAPQSDLRVGLHMCADAMSEARDEITRLQALVEQLAKIGSDMADVLACYDELAADTFRRGLTMADHDQPEIIHRMPTSLDPSLEGPSIAMPDQVEVTQEDREAVAKWEGICEGWHLGQLSSFDALLQAVARHRQAAIQKARADALKRSAVNVYYVIRYLPPKAAGYGEVTFAFSTAAPITMDDARTLYPEQFCAPGFYSLMQATGETYTPTAIRSLTEQEVSREG